MSEHTPGKVIIQHFNDAPQLCIEVPYWERSTEEATHPTFIATIYGPHPEEDAQRIAAALNSHDDLLAALERMSHTTCHCDRTTHPSGICYNCAAKAAIAKAKIPG